jgi:hypothetical protein
MYHMRLVSSLLFLHCVLGKYFNALEEDTFMLFAHHVPYLHPQTVWDVIQSWTAFMAHHAGHRPLHVTEYRHVCTRTHFQSISLGVPSYWFINTSFRFIA